VIDFTNKFYDELMFPASTVSDPRILMTTNINPKVVEKFAKLNSEYDSSEKPIMYIYGADKEAYLLTYSHLYYVLNLVDNKHLAVGKISTDVISKFYFEIGSIEIPYNIYVNDNKLTGIKLAKGMDRTNKGLREDYISLNEYFNRLKTKDFEITQEQVENIIIEKVNDDVLAKVKKYMIYDNERILYWCWGCDTGISRDYIVCTTAQIIVAEREIIYKDHEDIKQFYYDDIVSASVEQNSDAVDLTSFVIETYLTASTKTCDLYFVVPGGKLRVKTIHKSEADRIVQICNDMRKNKHAQKDVPQNNSVDVVEQIKKLKELLDMGILSEEEFNKKKEDLLSKM